MGHAFSWGGELGHLSLNLPPASWLLRMTILLGIEKHPVRRAEDTKDREAIGSHDNDSFWGSGCECPRRLSSRQVTSSERSASQTYRVTHGLIAWSRVSS
jgi:hypothetical protein